MEEEKNMHISYDSEILLTGVCPTEMLEGAC